MLWNMPGACRQASLGKYLFIEGILLLTDSVQQQTMDPLPDASIQGRDMMSSDKPEVRVVALWLGYGIELSQLVAVAVAEILAQLKAQLKKHYSKSKICRAICAILKIKS